MKDFEIEGSPFLRLATSNLDLKMLILWPCFCCEANEGTIEKLISKSIENGTKRFCLTKNALRNIIIQLYVNEKDWKKGKSTREIEERLDQLWEKCGICYFMLIKSIPSDVYQKGLTILKNQNDIKFLAYSICVPNSIYFLFRGKPLRFEDSFLLLLKFRKMLSDHNIPIKDFLVDSSFVMAMYGIRQANDLDYITNSKDSFISVEGIEEHDNMQKIYYSESIDNLIDDINFHFFFCGIKILTLKELQIFKQTRYNAVQDFKDFIDVKIIGLFLCETSAIKRKFIIQLLLFVLKIRNRLSLYGL